MAKCPRCDQQGFDMRCMVCRGSTDVSDEEREAYQIAVTVHLLGPEQSFRDLLTFKRKGAEEAAREGVPMDTSTAKALATVSESLREWGSVLGVHYSRRQKADKALRQVMGTLAALMRSGRNMLRAHDDLGARACVGCSGMVAALRGEAPPAYIREQVRTALEAAADDAASLMGDADVAAVLGQLDALDAVELERVS